MQKLFISLFIFSICFASVKEAEASLLKRRREIIKEKVESGQANTQIVNLAKEMGFEICAPHWQEFLDHFQQSPENWLDRMEAFSRGNLNQYSQQFGELSSLPRKGEELLSGWLGRVYFYMKEGDGKRLIPSSNHQDKFLLFRKVAEVHEKLGNIENMDAVRLDIIQRLFSNPSFSIEEAFVQSLLTSFEAFKNYKQSAIAQQVAKKVLEEQKPLEQSYAEIASQIEVERINLLNSQRKIGLEEEQCREIGEYIFLNDTTPQKAILDLKILGDVIVEDLNPDGELIESYTVLSEVLDFIFEENQTREEAIHSARVVKLIDIVRSKKLGLEMSEINEIATHMATRDHTFLEACLHTIKRELTCEDENIRKEVIERMVQNSIPLNEMFDIVSIEKRKDILLGLNLDLNEEQYEIIATDVTKNKTSYPNALLKVLRNIHGDEVTNIEGDNMLNTISQKMWSSNRPFNDVCHDQWVQRTQTYLIQNHNSLGQENIQQMALYMYENREENLETWTQNALRSVLSVGLFKEHQEHLNEDRILAILGGQTPEAAYQDLIFDLQVQRITEKYDNMDKDLIPIMAQRVLDANANADEADHASLVKALEQQEYVGGKYSSFNEIAQVMLEGKSFENARLDADYRVIESELVDKGWAFLKTHDRYFEILQNYCYTSKTIEDGIQELFQTHLNIPEEYQGEFKVRLKQTEEHPDVLYSQYLKNKIKGKGWKGLHVNDLEEMLQFCIQNDGSSLDERIQNYIHTLNIPESYLTDYIKGMKKQENIKFKDYKQDFCFERLLYRWPEAYKNIPKNIIEKAIHDINIPLDWETPLEEDLLSKAILAIDGTNLDERATNLMAERLLANPELSYEDARVKGRNDIVFRLFREEEIYKAISDSDLKFITALCVEKNTDDISGAITEYYLEQDCDLDNSKKITVDILRGVSIQEAEEPFIKKLEPWEGVQKELQTILTLDDGLYKFLEQQAQRIIDYFKLDTIDRPEELLEPILDFASDVHNAPGNSFEDQFLLIQLREDMINSGKFHFLSRDVDDKGFNGRERFNKAFKASNAGADNLQRIEEFVNRLNRYKSYSVNDIDRAIEKVLQVEGLMDKHIEHDDDQWAFGAMAPVHQEIINFINWKNSEDDIDITNEMFEETVKNLKEYARILPNEKVSFDFLSLIEDYKFNEGIFNPEKKRLQDLYAHRMQVLCNRATVYHSDGIDFQDIQKHATEDLNYLKVLHVTQGPVFLNLDQFIPTIHPIEIQGAITGFYPENGDFWQAVTLNEEDEENVANVSTNDFDTMLLEIQELFQNEGDELVGDNVNTRGYILGQLQNVNNLQSLKNRFYHYYGNSDSRISRSIARVGEEGFNQNTWDNALNAEKQTSVLALVNACQECETGWFNTFRIAEREQLGGNTNLPLVDIVAKIVRDMKFERLDEIGQSNYPLIAPLNQQDSLENQLEFLMNLRNDLVQLWRRIYQDDIADDLASAVIDPNFRSQEDGGEIQWWEMARGFLNAGVATQMLIENLQNSGYNLNAQFADIYQYFVGRAHKFVDEVNQTSSHLLQQTSKLTFSLIDTDFENVIAPSAFGMGNLPQNQPKRLIDNLFKPEGPQRIGTRNYLPNTIWEHEKDIKGPLTINKIVTSIYDEFDNGNNQGLITSDVLESFVRGNLTLSLDQNKVYANYLKPEDGVFSKFAPGNVPARQKYTKGLAIWIAEKFGYFQFQNDDMKEELYSGRTIRIINKNGFEEDADLIRLIENF